MVARTFADFGAGRIEFAERTPLLAEMFQRSCSGAVAARLLEESITWDVRSLLPDVQARTLIIHHLDDRLVPLALGQMLAAAIPDGRLVMQPGSAHGFMGNIDETVRAINAFLDEEPTTRRSETKVERQRQSRGPVLTVLFTDLVGHTDMMQRLGDERGREVLREHETIARNVLKTHGGTEVKTMGDGFMASFGSVAKAVECAVALQRAFAEREGEPLSIRVGLNAGEPIEEDGDLFGATVILASRIAAKAEGGEILVADTVRGLCSGKGFVFADRGEFVAKGFEEPVRVFEVRWRE
jgi:class 3 adenylate cyclase